LGVGESEPCGVEAVPKVAFTGVAEDSDAERRVRGDGSEQEFEKVSAGHRNGGEKGIDFPKDMCSSEQYMNQAIKTLGQGQMVLAEVVGEIARKIGGRVWRNAGQQECELGSQPKERNEGDRGAVSVLAVFLTFLFERGSQFFWGHAGGHAGTRANWGAYLLSGAASRQMSRHAGWLLGGGQCAFGFWLIASAGLVPWRLGFWQVFIPVFLATELAVWRLRVGCKDSVAQGS
jgi:hypothetical protein